MLDIDGTLNTVALASDLRSGGCLAGLFQPLASRWHRLGSFKAFRECQVIGRSATSKRRGGKRRAGRFHGLC